MSAEQELFVTAPTLNAYDYVYRIDREGQVRTLPSPLGRPQGLAFAPDGSLHVIDALAGASGVYRFADLDAPPELVVSGGGARRHRVRSAGRSRRRLQRNRLPF